MEERCNFRQQPQRAASDGGRGGDVLRQAGTLDHLPRTLLARATPADLAEAQTLAERGPMPLYLADLHLLHARHCLEDDHRLEAGNPSTARVHSRKPRTLIDRHGYGRRRPELEALEQRLGVAP